MNERIKELAGQAKCMAEETINKQISKNAELDAFAEKFAQLIVQECCKEITYASVGNEDPVFAYAYIDHLKNTLGVKNVKG